jgi:hypothetical protein
LHFALDGEAAQAVEQLEQTTREFAGESVILRFGRFWGPGTDYRTPPQPPTIHIDTAGAKAARLLMHAPGDIPRDRDQRPRLIPAPRRAGPRPRTYVYGLHTFAEAIRVQR